MPTAVVALGEMDEILTGGEPTVTWRELVAQLKAKLAAGEVTRAQIIGEMGWKAQEVAGEIDAGWFKEVTGAAETLAKVKEALGITGEMDVMKVAAEAKKALDEQARARHEALITETIKEKVAGEMAQALIRKMLHVPEGATKEQIAGEIDKLLADESLKETFSKLHIDKPAGVGATGKADAGFLRPKRVAI
jgi:hypothetical protein